MDNRSKALMRVSRISIAINFVLFLGKLLAGILARSGAMISDAVHSASDVFSTLVVMAGVKAAGKESDREHPYGHERMECVAAIILAVVLVITGLFIGYESLRKILHPAEIPTVPGLAALVAAAVSIVVKEGLFWYTRHYARALDSGAQMADAWHHRSDALSSIGALAGIAGARMGYPVFDPLAGLVICFFIGKAAIDIFIDAVNKMVDHSCDAETEAAIRECALGHEGLQSIDLLLTREFGEKAYIEMEISVDGSLPLVEAHAIAERIHDDIEAQFPQVKHIMIHVNPAPETGEGRV